MAGIAGTPKNKLNKIREEEIERDNEKVHAHHGVDLAAFLLRVKTGWEAGTSEPREQQI